MERGQTLIQRETQTNTVVRLLINWPIQLLLNKRVNFKVEHLHSSYLFDTNPFCCCQLDKLQRVYSMCACVREMSHIQPSANVGFYGACPAVTTSLWQCCI